MSDNVKQNLSLFDAMSTGELEALIRQDALLTEEGLDFDAIEYITSLLARREGTPPCGETDSQAALDRFHTHYLPAAGGGRSLYEEENTPAPVSRPHKRLSRVLLAAAVVAALLIGSAFAASSLGWLPRWDSETMRFSPARENQTEQPESFEGRNELTAALADCGAPEDLVPTYLPGGYEFLNFTSEVGSDGSIVFTSEYHSLFEYITLQYTVCSHPLSHTHAKDAGDPDIYTIGEVDHYITSNDNKYMAIWYQGNYEVFFFGFPSQLELIKTINSIYEQE